MIGFNQPIKLDKDLDRILIASGIELNLNIVKLDMLFTL